MAADATGIRTYNGGAVQSALVAGIVAGTLTFSISPSTKWPTANFTLVIDEGLSGEEAILCDSLSGGVITVNALGRGYDNTTAVTHAVGAIVRHVPTATDFAEANYIANFRSTPAKATPVDADVIPLNDSAAANILKSLSWANLKAMFPTFGLFTKASTSSCAFVVTGVGTISIAAGTYVDVNGTLITFAAQTAVTMPALTAGTDYFIYVSTAGVIQAVAASGTWPTPVASPPANSRPIGGFHYAAGGNATAQAGGNTTAQINAYSVWDLKWKPASDDPRGMTLVADKFWADIYLLNSDPQTNGTSKNNIAIADGATGGTTTCIVPTMFGGNGTTRYAVQDWWSTAEVLTAFGKRLPTYGEFQALAYGVTENQARGNDPVTTGIATTNAGTTADQLFTSKWGVIQASGVMDVWAHDLGGPYAAASWANINGGRGQVYNEPNAALLGGNWGDGVDAGSRSSSWIYSPSNSGSIIGGRGVCDHLSLV